MNRVKELRKAAGMQQKELALLIGVSNPTVSDWELNKKNPSGERLVKLAKLFKVDTGTILGYDSVYSPLQDNKIPILGNIACGERFVPDTNPSGYTVQPEEVHADFALRCKGDSMVPTFQPGDLVLIRKQPEVENGQIAAVSIDGEATLKHVYRQEHGLLLIADNPSYSPVYVPLGSDKEIIIHGLAVGYTRLFD